MSKQIGIDLNAFFNQYLRGIKIQVLEYKLSESGMEYRYQNTVDKFEMPLRILIANEPVWVSPKTEWQTLEKAQEVTFNHNFYIEYKAVSKD